MAIGAFVAGPYSSTYNGGALGSTDKGYTLQVQHMGERIEESDTWGQTLIDGVSRGANAKIICDCKEYNRPALVNTAVASAFWPWGGLGVILDTATAPAGRLWTTIAKALVLTKQGDPSTTTANTVVAGSSITSLTAANAIIAENVNLELVFDSRLRKVPLQFNLLPVVSGTALSHFTIVN